MVMQNVPWVIERDGVFHSGEVARSLAYLAAPVAGVGLPGDLRVTAASPEGMAVNVAGGLVAIPSTYPGHETETYLARNIDIERVELTPTGSQPRRDLIVAEVRDPQFGQGPEETADPSAGRYVRLTSIQGGPAGLTPQSVVSRPNPTTLLAEVNLPANCQAVSQSMIRNLRKVVRPLELSGIEQDNPANGTDNALPPRGSRQRQIMWKQTTVPPWATKMSIEITVNGMKFGLNSGILVAGLNVFVVEASKFPSSLGTISENGIVTQEAESNSWNLRQTVAMSGTLPVQNLRGKAIVYGLCGVMSTGGKVSVDYQSCGMFRWTFTGEAV